MGEYQYTEQDDGVLFSDDKKVIVKYNKESESRYTIPDFVTEISIDCFADATDLTRIDIGKNVTKIRNRGLMSDGYFNLKTIYIPPTVTELEGEIFDVGGDDGGLYYPISVVGGASGSVIEAYCNKRNITFVAVNEDEIEDFYAKSSDELYTLAKERAALESEFYINESENGYQAKFASGVLEFFGCDNAHMSDIVIKNTNVKINRFRREKVEKIIIGDHITELSDLAFDDYRNLKSVHIGASVQKISPVAFNGRNETYSFGCPNLESITVDENNKWYIAEDGVLYTRDYETLVKYCPAKPQLYHEIDSRVRHISNWAFEYAKNLQCLKVGDGCISIGKNAFINTRHLRHTYFAPSVEGFPDDTYPFFVQIYGYERPYIDKELVIGGADESAAQQYCLKHGLKFHVIEDDKIEDFMTTPLPDDETDPYVDECKKMMIVNKVSGSLVQAGEFGEELVLPEGVVYVGCSIDLSKCKRVVIPSTYTHPFGIRISGIGYAPLLEEFVVSEDNPMYIAVNGHLYNRNGTLTNYAPGAKDKGILPEGTTGIGEGAFSLIPEPFKKLYIPSTVKVLQLELQWKSLLFYEAEISPDNTSFKTIDGSIFTADGKTLVYAKISEDGYNVPDGTEIISKGALASVSGTVYIPESVTRIENEYGLGFKINTIRTPKNSYAEQYAKEKNIRVEITVDGVVAETLEPQKITYSPVNSFNNLPF